MTGVTTGFSVQQGEVYTQHAVIGNGTMDRPAADMCSGRAGHAAKLACGLGLPCAGETAANAPVGDNAETPSVLPKKGKHVPGRGTVTWHRLLDEFKIVATIHNEPDTAAIKQVTTSTVRLRLLCRHNRLLRWICLLTYPTMSRSWNACGLPSVQLMPEPSSSRSQRKRVGHTSASWVS